MATAEQKRARRRKAIEGFPKEEKFITPESVNNYFSQPKLQCMRCGKSYKSLAIHLDKIHGMAADEYKKIYGLPYYRGLIGCDTRSNLSEKAKDLYEQGKWVASPDQAEKARQNVGIYGDRRQEYRDVLTERNLEKMNDGKSGEESERRKAMSSWGSLKHIEKLRLRPQCSPPSENFLYYWTGKKQSRDHVLKRTGYEPKT